MVRPSRKARPERTARSMTHRLSDSAGLSVPGRVSILIVGDDPPASRAFAYMVQLGGHRVYTAFDRRSGLAVAAARYPGMVILDLRRVGIRHGDNNLQGFEVVKRCLHWLR